MLTLTEGTNIPSSLEINDFALSNNSFFKITGSTRSSINGFANGSSGRTIVVINTCNANQTFYSENTNSSAGNRFVLGISQLDIKTNGTITFVYVTGLKIGALTSQSRWVMTGYT